MKTTVVDSIGMALYNKIEHSFSQMYLLLGKIAKMPEKG